MDKVNQGVKDTAEAAAVVSPATDKTSALPTEEAPKEKAGMKILKDSPEETSEWKNQPASARLGETPPTVGNKEGGEGTEDKELDGIAKEKERVKAKADKIRQELDDLKNMRGEVKDLETQKEAIEQPVEQPEDDGWRRVETMIESKLNNVQTRTNFFEAKPEFYSGDDGLKNRDLINQYVAVNFKKADPTAYQMAHNYIFGEFERDSITRKAKTDEQKRLLNVNVATLGSATGGTSVSGGQPPRKRIIPRTKSVEDWY